MGVCLRRVGSRLSQPISCPNAAQVSVDSDTVAGGTAAVAGVTARIAGWGGLLPQPVSGSNPQSYPNTLHQVALNIVAKSTCESMLSTSLLSSQICAYAARLVCQQRHRRGHDICPVGHRQRSGVMACVSALECAITKSAGPLRSCLWPGP